MADPRAACRTHAGAIEAFRRHVTTPISAPLRWQGHPRHVPPRHVPLRAPLPPPTLPSWLAAASAGAYGDQWPGDQRGGDANRDSIGSSSGGAGSGGTATVPQTLFNYVNVIMGAGFVSMPFACRQGGWAALGVLWLLGVMFAWTGLVVLDCCERVGAAKRAQLAAGQAGGAADAAAAKAGGAAAEAAAGAAAAGAAPAGYEDVAEAAFGGLGRKLVSLIMYAELLGICTVYLVLEAETLSALLGATVLGDALRAAFPGGPAFVALAAAIVVPTVLLPDLAALSGLGALSVGSAVAVGLALAALWLGGAAGAKAAATRLVAPETLPQVLGCVAFVYAGHSTFPVVQQSMRQPSKAPSVLKFSYLCVVAICTLVGTFGYMLYGSGTADVITANLPAGTPVAVACLVLTAVSPFAAFALTLEPVALALQRLFSSGSTSSGGGAEGGQQQPPYPVRAAVRLGLAAACAAAAAVLPYVADLMSLVGAVLTMSISLMIPALMHVRLRGRAIGALCAARAAAVLVVGAVCAVVGADSALASLRSKMAAAAAAAAV